MKRIILPIKGEWYEMLLRGEKEDEYREIKPFYEVRFSNCFREFLDNMTVGGKHGTLNEWLFTGLVDFRVYVTFRNGYSARSPSFDAECTLSIGEGRPEWGAVPGVRYYRLHIEKITEGKDG